MTSSCATDRTSFGVSKLNRRMHTVGLSLHLSKCHIVVNHMSRLNPVAVVSVGIKVVFLFVVIILATCLVIVLCCGDFF